MLSEFQLGLLALSADQVESFANRLGTVLESQTRRIEDRLGEDRLGEALAAVANPALLVFDLIKHRGYNELHRWLSRHRDELGESAPHVARIYSFDRISGALIGFDEAGLLLDNLNELLDPRNIAYGHCSIGQMASAGAKTGNFGCGIGPHCRQTTAEGIDVKLIKDRFGRKRVVDTSAPPTTGFGVHPDMLTGRCGSVGAGGGQSGGGAGPFSGGHHGFASCMAGAMYLEAMANDPARCRLKAMAKLQRARSGGLVVVPGGEGGPMIAGILGEDGCQSNPRMDLPDGNRPVGPEAEAFNMQYSLSKLLKKKGSWLRAALQTATDHELSDEDFETLEESLMDADLCHDCLDKDEDNIQMGEMNCVGRGLSSDCQPKITMDVEHITEEEGENGNCASACQQEMAMTLIEELLHAAHALDMTLREWAYAGDDLDHSQMDALVEGRGTGFSVVDKAKKAAEEQKKKQQEQQQGGGQEKMPDPLSPPRQCGPVAEAYRDLMACEAGSVAGMKDGDPVRMPGTDEDSVAGKPSLGNTDGNVDPSEDQWIDAQYGDNAFSRCMAENKQMVVTADGKVRVIGGRSGQGQACGALDCMPPARARKVGGICRCVNEMGRGAALEAVAAAEKRRTCGAMIVDCAAQPLSPCCGNKGGVPGGLDLGDGGIGPDPKVFDPGALRLRDKLKIGPAVTGGESEPD
ncbi:hypothetical protein [Thiohalophilus sp.]|uniref:hypothetical protein n=1 Tax=Thiohalophilus sp. TaxID=3028392 RepID=UPI002ACEA549|nr:hypothetical protein [Thiohalophilus sp.]MDZ7661066.1 hypothetical protein [Thiohalophilus sp.]